MFSNAMKKILFLFLLVCLSFPCFSSGQVNPNPASDQDSVQTNQSAQSTPAPIRDAIQKTKPEVDWSISFMKINWAIISFLIAFFTIKYVTRFLEALAERWSNFRLFIKGLIPIFRISSWTFVIYIIIAGIFKPPIESLIAVTASAGIAVGFASQDILKNIFGGILILFDRPFQVGDKIQIGSFYGEVMSIGLRTVRIVTPDDSLVSIPNSEIVNQMVSNSNSGESNCQVVAEFYLPPDIDIQKVKQIAYRAAAVSKFAFLNKPITMIFKNEIHQGRSLLKMRLKAYVLDIRYEFPFMSDMTENTISELLKNELISAKDLAYVQSK